MENIEINVTNDNKVQVIVQPPQPPLPDPIVTEFKLEDLYAKRDKLQAEHDEIPVNKQNEQQALDRRFEILALENEKQIELNEFAIAQAIEQGAKTQEELLAN